MSAATTRAPTRSSAPSQPLPPVLRAVERELRVFRAMWRTVAFMHFVTPLFFLAAMGIGVGGLVETRTGDIRGVSYLQFIAPGLLAAFAMQSAAMSSTWGVLAHTKWIGSYHAAVATPMRPADVYGGTIVWTALRTGIQAVGFLAAALVLGGLVSWWSVLAIPAAMLGAMAFAAPLTAWAVLRDTDVGMVVVLRLGIMPLFMLSGTFFPVQQLPDWLEPLVWLSPLYHVVELCRGATTGSLGLAAGLAHVAFLVACTAIGWRIGTRNFARRLTP